jgi:hypothetical protein
MGRQSAKGVALPSSKSYLTPPRSLPIGMWIIVAAGLSSWSTPCVFAAEVQIPAPAAHNSADLRRQGKQLRAEIDAKFDKLTSSGLYKESCIRCRR